uniref:Uncharacterized protein n=1 Tax=Sphaerodactylus townsendi TaxID=933632 RepID=A0ACB8GET8_9SAUR
MPHGLETALWWWASTWTDQLRVPKKLLHETQPNPTSYQGVPQTRFPQLPREPDPNVIGDGTFISDASSSTADHILPEKEKGRSAATFYPLDTRPLLLPVDERTVVSNTMEPAGTGAEMELLSNILAASSFITDVVNVEMLLKPVS